MKGTARSGNRDSWLGKWRSPPRRARRAELSWSPSRSAGLVCGFKVGKRKSFFGKGNAHVEIETRDSEKEPGVFASEPASGACLNSERDGSEFENRNSWFSGQNLALWFRGPEFFEGGNAVPGGKISADCRNWGSRRWNSCSEKRDSRPGNWRSPRRPNRAFQAFTARALAALEPTKNSGLEFRHPGRKRRSGNWNSRSRNRRSPPRRARRAGCLPNFLAHRFAGWWKQRLGKRNFVPKVGVRGSENGRSRLRPLIRKSRFRVGCPFFATLATAGCGPRVLEFGRSEFGT